MQLLLRQLTAAHHVAGAVEGDLLDSVQPEFQVRLAPHRSLVDFHPKRSWQALEIFAPTLGRLMILPWA